MFEARSSHQPSASRTRTPSVVSTTAPAAGIDVTGDLAFVAQRGIRDLEIFDLTDPDHPRLTREIPVGRQPWHRSTASSWTVSTWTSVTTASWYAGH